MHANIDSKRSRIAQIGTDLLKPRIVAEQTRVLSWLAFLEDGLSRSMNKI